MCVRHQVNEWTPLRAAEWSRSAIDHEFRPGWISRIYFFCFFETFAHFPERKGKQKDKGNLVRDNYKESGYHKACGSQRSPVMLSFSAILRNRTLNKFAGIFGDHKTEAPLSKISWILTPEINFRSREFFCAMACQKLPECYITPRLGPILPFFANLTYFIRACTWGSYNHVVTLTLFLCCKLLSLIEHLLIFAPSSGTMTHIHSVTNDTDNVVAQLAHSP